MRVLEDHITIRTCAKYSLFNPNRCELVQVASCGGGGDLISKSDSVRDRYFARVCDLLGKCRHKTSSTGSKFPEIRQEMRNLRKDVGLGALVRPVDSCMEAGRD